MKAAPKKSAVTLSAGRETEHVTRELYKQNLELAERNKTLSLLRKIDELVLDSEVDAKEVAQKITQITLDEIDFSLVAIFVANKKRDTLAPYAMSTRVGSGTTQGDILRSIFNHKLPIKKDDSLISESRRTGKIMVAKSLDSLFGSKLGRHSADLLKKETGIKNWFVCPLGARWESIGVMIIGIPVAVSRLLPYRRTLIERLSSAVGVAIDNKLLYKEIQESSLRLRIANKRLRELDEAKDEFISMASHQLRTPLTSIKGYLSMLSEGDAGKLKPQQTEFTELALTSAQRMVYLIADMLNVSRINTGKLVIDKRAFDLGKTIKDEIKQLSRTAEAHGVKMKFSNGAPQLGLVNLDEGKMRQVIMNFLDNAMYYAPNSTVEVSLEGAGGKLRFSVRDHGIGVPEREKAKLFKKFYRAPNARQARPDGTGLGLYMAKMVVELQGGKILFDSQPGKGSTFGFEFPLASIKTRASKKSAPAIEPVTLK